MTNRLSLIIISLYLFVVSIQANSHLVEPDDKTEIRKITLMLEWFVNPNHGPIIVAQQKGFFRKEGLEVKIQEPTDPALPPKLVATGDVDLAVYYQPGLTQGVDKGLSVAWAGTLIDHVLDGIMVLDNGLIKSLANLKGKKIGVSFNGAESAKLDTMFKPYGFSAKNITMINVGWNLSSPLMSGQVDAVMGVFRNFELNVLKSHGSKGSIFCFEENGIPPYDQLIFIANSKKHDKAVIRSFLRSIEDGIKYIVNNPEESWKVFVNHNPKQLDNKLNKSAWIDTVPYFAKSPAFRNNDRYERYAQFLYEHALIKKRLKADDLMVSFF
ncbi:MAG: ABC transporter substrate-binding protein [Candidatus Endonucleobacter sp. (ex Gigantidas childressi)]|nr:ABC transporter substrate-binding protein [Candidatus Endonucleobacter sp. (ex Gigantidas childressi)]